MGGLNVPKLPDNFDQLNEDQQQQALLETELAKRCKFYEMQSLVNHEEAYDALTLDRRFWEPFVRCRHASNNTIIPLREILIRVYKGWSLFGLPEDCPFTFTETEMEKHEKELLYHRQLAELQTIARQQLETDDEGWVPPQDFERVKAMNQHLLGMFLETEEFPEEEAMRMWPFPAEPKLVDMQE